MLWRRYWWIGCLQDKLLLLLESWNVAGLAGLGGFCYGGFL